MTEGDARLNSLLRVDEPPALDPWFRIAVLERMARRRLHVRLALVSAIGAGLAAAAAAASPHLPELTGTAAVGFSLTISTAATLWGLVQIRRPL